MEDIVEQAASEEGSKIFRGGNVGGQDFAKIKEQCLSEEVLFEDPHFPAEDSSVYYANNMIGNFEWMRPREISDDPQFFISGASRFDVKQGRLGDCWFLAAVANLTLNEKLFHKVVPEDNTFEEGDYCGAFHFRFWQYGQWVDVVIDDRLPTRGGHLVLMHSVDDNEFWSALLEKAYAKLHGSYESLVGGNSIEALTDFTGGVTETYKLNDAPENLFEVMEESFKMSSFLGCAIGADPSTYEAKTGEGLVRGHAYSITGLVTVPDTETPLLRIRNPWGNEVEWNGPWSDGSSEWESISDETKEELGLTFKADGEFWMSFDDFMHYFDKLEICHLSVDLYGNDGEDDVDDGGQKRYQCNTFDGQWIRGATAGGCINHRESFPNNPQYVINLVDPDEDDDNQQCTLLIALMQKNRRAQKKYGRKCLTIGFTLYSLSDPDTEPKPLPGNYFRYNGPAARGPTYTNVREVSKRFSLDPGTYVVIPSTFNPNEDGDFVLRVFTESKVDMIENDGDIGIGEVDDRVKDAENEDEDHKAKIAGLFDTVAGEDGEIDWSELKDLLDTVMMEVAFQLICEIAKYYQLSEFQFEDGFSKEVCRSMMALMDADMTGKLGLDEFTRLWKSIWVWTTVFRFYDDDNSGHLDAFELRQALTSAGYTVNNKVLQALQLRYGDSSGNVSFDDFIGCAIKLKALMDVFIERSSGDHETNFSLEEWLMNTLYS